MTQIRLFSSTSQYQKKISKGTYKTTVQCLILAGFEISLMFSLFVCFCSLKVQQGLLIDFASFPQKFIDLLNLCNSEQESDNPRYEEMEITHNITLFNILDPSCTSCVSPNDLI